MLAPSPQQLRRRHAAVGGSCAEAIAATTKKLEKTAIVADYFKSRSHRLRLRCRRSFSPGGRFRLGGDDACRSAGRLLWRLVAELPEKMKRSDALYRRHGDLGAVAGRFCRDRGQGARRA